MTDGTIMAVHHDVQLSADDKTLAVHVPMQFRKRGGRKVVIAPSGEKARPNDRRAVPRSSVDNGLVTALAKAFCWQRMLDEGRFTTIDDLAQAEKLDPSLVSRTLRLTLLAPDIMEAILNGTQPAHIERQTLLQGFPVEWGNQLTRR